MPQAIVWIFLTLAGFFAAVHNFAVSTSLYWYYSWFDIVMHFWGGILTVLGVYALCSLRHIPLKPTTVLIFATLLVTMLVWEVFEWSVGLIDPLHPYAESIKDLIIGFCGGLVGYLLALRLRM